LKKLKTTFYVLVAAWFIVGLILGCYDFITSDLSILEKIVFVQFLVIVILIGIVLSPKSQ
jgi:hypothetical protein